MTSGTGSCTVTFDQAGSANYNAAQQVVQTTAAQKATATVTPSNLRATYDGTPKAAAAAAPSGLSVDITYDGLGTAPTAAGSYAVRMTVNDANYQGSADGTLVIAKAKQTITVTRGAPSSAGYRTSFPVTATAPGGPVVIAPSGACAISGSLVTMTSGTGPCTVTFDQTGSANYNAAPRVAQTTAAQKAAATVTPSDLRATYDGTPKPATATTTPAGLSVRITYEVSAAAPTSAGSYAVVATVNDAHYQGSAGGTLVIGKATAGVSLSNLSQTYDGTPKAATVATTPAGLRVNITYEGSATAPTTVGTHAVTATINDANYQGSGGGTLVIAKAGAIINLGNLVQVYDGRPKPVTVATSPANLTGVAVTYSGSSTAPSAAGRYPVLATLTNDNYQASPATRTLEVLLANAGPAQTVNAGEPVTLGGASGVGMTFQWTQVAGSPTVALTGASTLSPSFAAPQLSGGSGSTVLSFQLTVSDGPVRTSDTVDVTVKNINHAPVAVLGATTRTVREGSPVTLDGSLSYDPDSDPISYIWTQTYGPTVILTGDTTATAAFTSPLIPAGAGGTQTLKFTLTVSDGRLSSTLRDVTVTVDQVDHAPTANAGTNQTVNVNTTPVTLHGSGQDPDGDPITFTWTQTGGAPVRLSNIHAASPTFTAPASPTTLVFQLVTTAGGLSSPAWPVQVFVVSPVAPPNCNLAQASPSSLWPPDHKLVPVRITGVTDPTHHTVTITATGVTQDEPTSGLGDGDASPDAVLQGSKALLRAERDGNGDGRVYKVSFSADDGHGGTCTGSVKVGVPHDQGTGKTPVDSGQSYNSLQP